MGRISSTVGLITGLPIAQTVDQLVAIQARPRDLLTAKVKKLEQQQVGVTTITALLIGVQATLRRLKTPSVYQQRTAASSLPDVLGATITGTPPVGSYQFTAIQKAQSQQLQSSKFANATTALGAGSVSFRFGGFVDTSTPLDLLNGGEGFEPGKIRVTDRSGASAEIDLRYARDIADVVRAINENGTINVTAEAVGDHLQLTDKTGQTASNLRVQEVGAGQTAASLGLSAIDVAANSANGADILTLFDEIQLDRLNDGRGVRFDSALPDLKIQFRDGTETEVDFRKAAIAGTRARATTTAAGGLNSQITFTAVQAGSTYDGVQIRFVDDAGVTKGNETASYDENTKTLTFQIDAGQTTANDILAAVTKNTAVSSKFTAARATGGNGSGLVSVTDSAVTAGLQATATSTGTNGANAKVTFTAVQGGAIGDGVTIQFVDSPGISAGAETVVYDDSNPLNKTLTFQIAEGETTADQIIAALNDSPSASAVFRAERAAGSNGSGTVSASDTVVSSGGAIIEPVAAGSESTLENVIATLTAATAGKLSVTLDPAGKGLVLTDLTVDNGAGFEITNLNGSKAASDLGLTAAANGDEITTRPLLSGLSTTLLSSLDGGRGVENLGLLSITDRSGANANVDLSGVATLSDVIETINAAGLNVSVRVNDARNGIVLVDSTVSPTSNLIVANGDGTTSTATRLKLEVNTAQSSKNSGSLDRQTVNENTLLKSLNAGAGVSAGTFRITDTTGASATIDVNSNIKTIGDLLTEIDRKGLAIEARVNDRGDGIVLVDTADGSSTLSVTEGTSKAAHDLHLLGSVEDIDVEGEPTKAINASTTFRVELDADDTLSDFVTKLNALKAGVSASIFNDGSSVKPFRLLVSSQQSGARGELSFDTSELGFTISESVAARDALLLYGAPGATGGLLASSSTDTFTDVLSGVTLELKQASASPVTVTVSSTDAEIVNSVQASVDAFNRLFDKIRELTAYNADTDTSAALRGDGSTLRVESDISRLLTGRLFSAGAIRSLAELGINVTGEGKVTLDATRLKTTFNENPAAVEQFFSSVGGIVARFDTTIESLAGVGNSVLVGRAAALTRQITTSSDRVTFLNERLDAVRERLLKQFQASEVAIAKIQSNLSAINSIAPISL